MHADGCMPTDILDEGEYAVGAREGGRDKHNDVDEVGDDIEARQVQAWA